MALTKAPEELVDKSLTSTLTITTADNSNNLVLASTDADANFGPRLKLFRNSASAADGDAIGYINFTGTNDAGTPEEVGYAALDARIVDASDGTEDGRLEIVTLLGGVEGTSRILMDATETVFNDNSKDLDFRVESDTNTHAFFVQASDSTLGINTSSPLNVFDTQFSASAHTSGISITNQQNGGYGSALAFNSSRSDDSSIKTAARVRTEGAEAWGADSTTSSNLIFETRSDNTLAERMRIAANGTVSIGRNESAAASDHGIDLYNSGHLYIFVSSSGDSDAVRVYNSSGTQTAAIDADGDYHDLSDERYKENIVDAPSVLDTISKMKVRSFNWKEDGRKKTYGFIAQELNEVASETVRSAKDEEDVWGVKHARIVPMLTKAVQEQQALIETLEAKVKALEEA